MRVQVYDTLNGDLDKPFEHTVYAEGELADIALGNDGLWLHLRNCKKGCPEQVISMDHRHLVRPMEGLTESICFQPVPRATTSAHDRGTG